MNAFEETALGCYLSNWPEHLSFAEILFLLRDDETLSESQYELKEEIDIWEVVQDYDPNSIITWIENLHDNLKERFIEKD